jgi:hypothetical protein
MSGDRPEHSHSGFHIFIEPVKSAARAIAARARIRHADRQRELIDEYLAIGDILFKQNNESGAAEQYQNALKVAQDFQAENPTSTSLASITHLITQKIQDLRVSQEGK